MDNSRLIAIFSISRSTSTLCREFLSLPDSSKCSNFMWNHTNLISLYLKITINRQIVIHGFHFSRKLDSQKFWLCTTSHYYQLFATLLHLWYAISKNILNIDFLIFFRHCEFWRKRGYHRYRWKNGRVFFSPQIPKRNYVPLWSKLWIFFSGCPT